MTAPASTQNSQGRKLTIRDVCTRYGVVARTIDRWTETGVLPKPLYINKRRYWDADQIAECERRGMTANKSETAA